MKKLIPRTTIIFDQRGKDVYQREFITIDTGFAKTVSLCESSASGFIIRNVENNVRSYILSEYVAGIDEYVPDEEPPRAVTDNIL